jgi:hypothetical protein
MTGKRTQGKARRGGRVWPLIGPIGLCLFVGFWGFVYQGYTEDAGSKPTQSWPIGAAAFAVAGVLALLAIRRAKPGMSKAGMVVAAVGITVALAAAAVGSLDAGNK